MQVKEKFCEPIKQQRSPVTDRVDRVTLTVNSRRGECVGVCQLTPAEVRGFRKCVLSLSNRVCSRVERASSVYTSKKCHHEPPLPLNLVRKRRPAPL
jgi:hypothetical protein